MVYHLHTDHATTESLRILWLERQYLHTHSKGTPERPNCDMLDRRREVRLWRHDVDGFSSGKSHLFHNVLRMLRCNRSCNRRVFPTRKLAIQSYCPIHGTGRRHICTPCRTERLPSTCVLASECFATPCHHAPHSYCMDNPRCRHLVNDGYRIQRKSGSPKDSI